MRFYDEHAEHRDRFEIIALCVDHDGDLESLEELDRQLQSVVQHVWNGQQLPFPVLLDSSFRTCQSFGVRGVGHTVLIDPTGKLVEGDVDSLAKAIDKERE